MSRILIVEDEVHCAGLRFNLKEGHFIETAERGEDALGASEEARDWTLVLDDAAGERWFLGCAHNCARQKITFRCSCDRAWSTGRC